MQAVVEEAIEAERKTSGEALQAQEQKFESMLEEKEKAMEERLAAAVAAEMQQGLDAHCELSADLKTASDESLAESRAMWTETIETAHGALADVLKAQEGRYEEAAASARRRTEEVLTAQWAANDATRQRSLESMQVFVNACQSSVAGLIGSYDAAAAATEMPHAPAEEASDAV